MTYILRNQYSDSAKKELSAFLLKVVQSVFERFVQQDRIRYTELEELVYTTFFDKTAFDEAAEKRQMRWRFRSTPIYNICRWLMPPILLMEKYLTFFWRILQN